MGAIAGVTIFIGLPVGRLRNAAPRTRALLNAAATGILVFLVWDVLSHAWEPIDAALSAHEIGAAGGYGAVLAVAFTVGIMGLVYLDRWIARRARHPVPVGPGAPAETAAGALAPAAVRARRLAMMIAVGIGLHNFAEGLAIGSSAGSGALQLAVLLVIGFALHNATEGFGIVAPLGDPESIAALAAWTRPCGPAVPDGAAPNSCQSCPDPCPRSTHAPDPAHRPYPSPGDVMARYLAGRVAQAVVVLWAAYTVSFVVLFALPGDPVSTLLGADSSDVSAEQVDAVRAQYGFDRPLPVQYVQQLGRVLREDLGRSVGTGRPVVDLIAEAVPPTAQITAAGLLVAVVVGGGLAIAVPSARRRWCGR